MDDADLRRLAEIGIDVYLPRGPARAACVEPVAASMAAATAAATAVPNAGGVVLLAEASGARAAALLDGVKRALAFARVDCVRIDVVDEAALASASALVAFGDARARAAGAALSAQRQREIGWVVTAEPGLLAGDAHAKRALWSELKRIARPLLQVRRAGARASRGDER
ncbi:hypothetical protein [Dokdonella sp.]|uniref:hypothetical protein n=1 Tax=Dokdonella sp. TaxID=2291710 RepID=UPI002F3F657D